MELHKVHFEGKKTQLDNVTLLEREPVKCDKWGEDRVLLHVKVGLKGGLAPELVWRALTIDGDRWLTNDRPSGSDSQMMASF